MAEKDTTKSEQTEREVRKVVGEYQDRPYEQAVSKEHKEFLAQQEGSKK